MIAVLLNGIDFNVENFSEDENDGLSIWEFSIFSISDRDYYLTKEILGKKNVTFEVNGQEKDVRVKSYSYRSPEELNSNTRVQFNVTLEEKSEDDVIDTNAGLTFEAFRVNHIIKALVKLVEEKGIFAEEEFKEYYDNNYLTSVDKEKEMNVFMKRVFNYEQENEE